MNFIFLYPRDVIIGLKYMNGDNVIQLVHISVYSLKQCLIEVTKIKIFVKLIN